MPRIFVITGTDTGVGKTVFTSTLAFYLKEIGQHVAALKPICSGGRGDATLLRRACKNELSLDEVNPWHFRAALAPLLAARHEEKTLALRDVVAHVREIAHRFQIVLVEGAGGLLSPLGEHFCTRELIAALGAEVIIVAPNKLGVVNAVRLTLEALPPLVRGRARVVLMCPGTHDSAARTNPALLAEFMPAEHLLVFPFVEDLRSPGTALKSKALLEGFSALLH